MELQRIFESLDQDGDGEVSVDELGRLLERTGEHVSRDELAGLVGREGLGLGEFSHLYESLVVKIEEEEEEEEERCLREAFKVFDLDGDGLLSPEEIREVLSRLGMWSDNGAMDCARIVREYDTNSDGVVDFDEFKRMMLAVR